MKKWRNAVLALLTIWLIRAEHTGVRIERLEPAETLLVTRENGRIHLKTDTGAEGVGDTLDNAVDNLHSSASGEIFLDTLRYLALGTTEKDLLEPLAQLLRPTVRVCCLRGTGEPEEITRYLNIHPPGKRLTDVKKDKTIPILYYQEGRGQLVDENNPQMDGSGNADPAGPLHRSELATVSADGSGSLWVFAAASI